MESGRRWDRTKKKIFCGSKALKKEVRAVKFRLPVKKAFKKLPKERRRRHPHKKTTFQFFQETNCAFPISFQTQKSLICTRSLSPPNSASNIQYDFFLLSPLALQLSQWGDFMTGFRVLFSFFSPLLPKPIITHF